MSTTRHYNQIDLLRIVAITMVTFLHVALFSGVLRTSHQPLLWLFESIGLIGVNLFALMSGFVYAQRSIHLKHLLNYWLIAIFYAILLPLINALLFHQQVTWRELQPLQQGYWYLYSYTIVLIFLWATQSFWRHWSKRILITSVLVGLLINWLIEYQLPIADGITRRGYSPFWLLLLFSIGYLWQLEAKRLAALKWVFATLLVVSLASTWLINLSGLAFADKLAYNSPWLFGFSLSVFGLSLALPIKRALPLANGTFGVYMIVANQVIIGQWLPRLFPIQFGGMVLVTIGLVVSAFVLEVGRQKILQIFKNWLARGRVS